MFRAYEPAGDRRDRLVAVKVFRLDLTPEQAATLAGELTALAEAGLDHPNIAAPIAAGLEHGAAYLAQQYAVGESLDVVLRDRGPLPLSEVAGLVETLAAAIDHAASRGVHHGSLHLRDVILADEAPRVTGFGVAAALAAAGVRRPTRPQYSAPDGPSDVYSLGAIAFEAATGKRVSAENLAMFQLDHGVERRRAFDAPLAANPAVRSGRASDFAAALKEAVFMTSNAHKGRGPADAPMAAGAPDVPAGDLDLRIDQPVDLMGEDDDLMEPGDDRREPGDDLMGDADEPVAAGPSWAPPPPRALQVDAAPEPATGRWPIVAAFTLFAVLTALAVGYVLRSPRPEPMADAPPVEETTVDLPAPEAAAPASAPAPASASAAPPAAPVSPSPSPSRLASGASRSGPTGSVLVRSTPADAEVFVNGEPRGVTPLALRDLALGSYTIRVARDGYATEEQTLRLTAQRPTASTTVALRPEAAQGAAGAAAGVGGLRVQSRPQGARVFVNGKPAGSTPIAIPGLPAGSATVRIELSGYKPWTTTVEVEAGGEKRIGASLEGQ